MAVGAAPHASTRTTAMTVCRGCAGEAYSPVGVDRDLCATCAASRKDDRCRGGCGRTLLAAFLWCRECRAAGRVVARPKPAVKMASRRKTKAADDGGTIQMEGME